MRFQWAMVLMAALACPPAGGAVLYVITACPYSTGSINKMPAILHRVNERDLTLAVARTIIPEGKGVHFIQTNPEWGVVIASSPSVPPEQYEVVRTAAPAIRESFAVVRPDLSSLYTHFFQSPSGKRSFGVNLVNYQRNPPRDEWVGVDLDSLAQSTLSPDILLGIVIPGACGIDTTRFDQISVFPFDDGRLTFRQASRAIESPWVLPRELFFESNAMLSIRICTKDMLVVSGIPRVEGPVRTMDLRILERGANGWKALKLPFPSILRAFGPWLSVLIQEEDWSGVRSRSSSAVETTPTPRKVSPGQKERLAGLTRNWCTLDGLMDARAYYRPGRLVLYNVRTGKQHTIETGQGDSEILLVEGNSVYYRTDRSLWKAAIGEKGIGKPVLLAEDYLIRDVHWAFLGPEIPPKKK